MRNPTVFRRILAAVALVSTALLSAASQLLAPPFSSGGATQLLADVHDGGAAAALSAGLFVAAQLPFIVAALAIGHVLRERAPVASNVGTTLAVLGGFGHAVIGGVSLLEVAMASDVHNRQVMADAIDRFQGSPGMLFAAFGTLGTVLGLLVLAYGLWRAEVGHRWVPLAIVVFLVVEFVGTSLSSFAGDVSVVLYLASFTALAATVWQTGNDAWERRVDQPAAQPVPA